jgi:chromosome segregation ATPase
VFGIYSLFKCDTIDENHEEYCECAKAHFDNAQKTSEQKTGMEKIKELKNRLGNLAMTDDRPAVWRICRSLVESLDEIENEHFTEMEDLSHANTVLKAELDKANILINEQMSKIQEADEEIKKLNARDDDRVGTISGYQKDLERLSFISAEKEKTIKEITYERDVRGKAIDTLRKQLADAQEQVRAMSALANSAMGEAQTYRWRTAEPLFPAFGVETHIDGATVMIGRDAGGKLQQYGDPIVTIQMPHDVYTEQKAKFESQAKEIE